MSYFLSRHHSILGPGRFLPYDRGPGLFGYFPHHRGHIGPGGFRGGIFQQEIYIKEPKRGFFGNLADALLGFAQGYSATQYALGGASMMQAGMYDYSVMQQMMMQQQMVQYQALQQQQQQSVSDFNNLKAIADAKGFIVLTEGNGYLAYNKTTNEHYSGDYNTVLKAMMGKSAETETETETETGAKAKAKTGTSTETGTPTAQGASSKLKPGVISAENAGKIKGKTITIQDDGIANSEINGKIKALGEADTSTKFPTIIEIESSTHGEIVAELDEIADNGGATYKAEGTNGIQIYRLEADANGEIILTQHKGDSGYGKSNWPKLS